ncbi:glycoside hydrolase family 3 N-terminal domain-containing protein, partial [Actinoplanes sp. NPDC051633]|uniref:glycoside hydrolase family 3 N-terminal domain-containing protein n=1 Tax=Actinoplanes sp. NPDC051633 TaxID=3155670 RepID=UPI0034195806
SVWPMDRRWGCGLMLGALLLATACSSEEPPQAGPSVPSVAQSQPPSASPAPSASAPVERSCEEQLVGRMTPEQRAGQLLMIGTEVDDPGGLRDEIRQFHLGGVFLHGRSTRPAAALKKDIADLQAAAQQPLLVALDQEGGSVQTLKGADFPRIPSAERLGAGPVAQLRAVNRDSARRLRGIGVNINLAPVADTVPKSLGEDNPPIGSFHRQYGDDPAEVAADIEQVVAASQGEQVLTVIKHFPGLGRTRFNTDTSTKAVDNTATVTDPFLRPFAAGIKAGSASVMLSSASYPKLDPSTIAAFSKPIITGLLRERMGFDGMVMSDDLGAAKAAETISPGQRAVRFVAAGGDMPLSIVPEHAEPMAKSLSEQAAKDPGFATRVTEAARHVVRAKIRAGVGRC